MAEQTSGWRGFADDAQRIYFFAGIAAAIAAAVWAGTYWGWWAYVWQIALPVRVVGIVGIVACVFVIWYGLLFTSHYYLKRPAKNPFVRPVSDLSTSPPPLNFYTRDRFEQNTYRIDITNNGPTDTFATQVTYIYPASAMVWPLALKWGNSDQESREIIAGHTQTLEVVHVTHTKAAERIADGRFELEHFLLRTPTGDVQLPLNRDYHRIIYMHINFRITSVASGASNKYSVHVQAANDGHTPPRLNGILKDEPY